MRLELVSSGATAQHNEDWVGAFRSPGLTDLVVIDGGTSVADRDYVDPKHGDVVWFVNRLAAALGDAIGAGLDQQRAVHAAAGAVAIAFGERAAVLTVPQYAWPIAAMSWIRASGLSSDRRLSLYCLGDCKVLMRAPTGAVTDLDPWVNPQEAVLRAEIGKLQAAGVTGAAQRQARLLPLLRQRRIDQNTVVNPTALCLHPNGEFAARRYEVSFAPGSGIIAMTDGFYRLVDTYGLHTDASLFAACEGLGLEGTLDTLRRFEAQSRAEALTVKRADDASAILWQPGLE